MPICHDITTVQTVRASCARRCYRVEDRVINESRNAFGPLHVETRTHAVTRPRSAYVVCGATRSSRKYRRRVYVYIYSTDRVIVVFIRELCASTNLVEKKKKNNQKTSGKITLYINLHNVVHVEMKP